MKDNFSVEKNLFENKIYYNHQGNNYLICDISSFNNDLEISITGAPKKIEKAILIDIHLDSEFRDTQIQSHTITGDLDILSFKNISEFSPLKSGKTPNKIRQAFTDGSFTYNEVFAKCKINSNHNGYFCIRKMDEQIEKDDLNEFESNKLKTEIVFLIGMFIYDPKMINHDENQVLQCLYATKVKMKDLIKK